MARFTDALLELLYPTRCAVCEAAGELLCANCREALAYIDHASSCRLCGAPHGRRLCTECIEREGRQVFAFAEALSVLEFNAASQSLIVAYKDGNERRLAPLLADLLMHALPLEWRLWADALTWIPADAAALRRRGFDHMQLIALALAELLQITPLLLLDKAEAFDQRRLSRLERRENARVLFNSLPAMQIEPQLAEPLDQTEGRPLNVLLLDDVFTTGASLNAAAECLKELPQVSGIRALTLARVW